MTPIPSTHPVIHYAFEHGGYIIEVCITIFHGRRICIREADDPNMFYLVNWCAGQQPEHCKNLVGLARGLIDAGMPKFPFQSNVKPYFNDPDFCEQMKRIPFEYYEFTISTLTFQPSIL